MENAEMLLMGKVHQHRGLAIPTFSVVTSYQDENGAGKKEVGAKVRELRMGSSSSVPELVKSLTYFKNDESGMGMRWGRRGL